MEDGRRFPGPGLVHQPNQFVLEVPRVVSSQCDACGCLCFRRSLAAKDLDEGGLDLLKSEGPPPTPSNQIGSPAGAHKHMKGEGVLNV